jgi:hypothetical protein
LLTFLIDIATIASFNTTAIRFAGWLLSIFLTGLPDTDFLADTSLLDIRSTSYGVEKKNLG